MNPVPGLPAGWSSNVPAFPCPFVGCGCNFSSTGLLRYHVDHTHLYPPPQFQQQQQKQSLGQQNSRCAGPHPLRNASSVSSPITSVSPANETLQQPVYQYGTCPPESVSSSSQRSPPAHGPMPPPPVQSQAPPPNPGGQVLTDQEALSEAAKSWPATAHALLKDLVITYGVFTAPQTMEEHDKLVQLYEKFYADTKTLRMNLARNDDILWQLFTMKVDIIQGEMLAQMELISTPQGLVHKKLPRNKSFLTTPRQESLSTPPTAPELPTKKLNDGMEAWNSMDGKAQTRMIGKILRAAKDPQRVVIECEAYIGEIRGREEREARIDIKQPSGSCPAKETNARPTQNPNPSKTPDPIAKSLDLKTMIEKSLKEMRMKRALEKQVVESSENEEDEEESEPKRIKVEPLD